MAWLPLIVSFRAIAISAAATNPTSPSIPFNVEDANGNIYEIEAGSGDTSGIASGATVTLPPQAYRNPSGKINLAGGALVQKKKKNRDLQQDGSATDLRRHLADNIGTKTVVAVRVVASGGAYNAATPAGLSDDVFGTGSDTFNLKSAYEGCSHDQLTINPGGAANGIVDGVVTITVDTAATSGNDGVMRNAVTDAIKAQFGVSHPTNIADHWMYCLPPGVMGGIAYAFVNSWMSVYSNQWCNYPSAQVHELGHNFNYAHSNEGSTNYADQSGMMGYSYSQDEGPVMCFNAAKSWQTGWFNSKRVNMNIGGSAATDNCFETDITGQADYDAALSQTILVKMNRSSGRDLFLMYNKKTGVNSGTVEGGNTVMIVEADGEGTSYGQSWLMAKLGAGGSKTFTNYLGDGRDLVVTVPSIGSAARVKIEFGGLCSTNPPTPNPTPAPVTPTPPPTPLPSNPPTPNPTAPPSNPPTPIPTNPPTPKPTPAPVAPTPPPTPAPTFPPVYKYACSKWEPAQSTICSEGSTAGGECSNVGTNNGCRKGGKSCWWASCPGGPPSPTPPPAPVGCTFCAPINGECCGNCVDNGKPSNRGCFA